MVFKTWIFKAWNGSRLWLVTRLL